ncbi:MAG: prepilin peptidase [bacterium]|nr:prepilin peptidase [bacterium]
MNAPVLYAAVLGAALASFAEASALRLTENRSGWLARSRCGSCGSALSALELLPIVSYLALRGRCARCRAPIPVRCIVVELIGAFAGASLGACYAPAAWPQLAVAVALAIGLGVSALTDLDTGYVYDFAVAAPIAVIALAALWAGRLPDALTGGALCGGALAALRLATRGCGMGAGDVKLAIVIGSALGPWGGARALGAAFVCGAAVSLALLAVRRARWRDRVAFAPYLALGTLTSVLVHSEGLH